MTYASPMRYSFTGYATEHVLTWQMNIPDRLQSPDDRRAFYRDFFARMEALPGVGKATARSIMSEVGISEARRVRGLGPHQREALVSRFG